MAVELGVAYVSLIPSTSKFVPEFNKTIGSAQGAASSGGKGLGGVMFGALAGVGMSLMNKAIGTISDSMGSAISRVDTLNAFPKVMANLGYSADDAQASITKMSDKLAGLPTSLDTMAGAVQVMAPLTASLDEATNISLALNNALIAGGKSTQEQSNAMQQYVQMLSTGKPDMQAWKSMVSAMPGQMDQLAKSLLGADANQTGLYEAMKDGTVTFDDFNQELLKLNDTGLDGFASFQTQAQDATGGIGTSLANLGTAITRNLANVIQELKPQIDAVVTGLTTFANAAGPAVIVAVQGIGDAFAWVGDNWEWLGPLVVTVGTAVGVFGAWTGAIALWTKITTIAEAVQLAFNTALIANPIGAIVAAVVALVAGLIWFFTQTELGQQIWANFTQFLSEAWANVSSFFIATWENIKSFFAAALQFVVDLFLNWTVYGLIIKNWDSIVAFFVSVWENIKSAFSTAVSWVSDSVTNFLSFVGSIWSAGWSAISSFFSNIWNSIVSAATGFFNSVKSKFTAVTDFVRGIPGKILGYFANIGSTLINSGKSLIQGFSDGIMAGFNKAKDFVSDGLGKIRDLFPFSPAKDGPFSGRGWVAYSGMSVGQTFTESIAGSLHDGRKDIRDELGGIQDDFAGASSGGFSVQTAVPVGAGSDVAAGGAGSTFNLYDTDGTLMATFKGLLGESTRSVRSGALSSVLGVR